MILTRVKMNGHSDLRVVSLKELTRLKCLSKINRVKPQDFCSYSRKFRLISSKRMALLDLTNHLSGSKIEVKREPPSIVFKSKEISIQVEHLI